MSLWTELVVPAQIWVTDLDVPSQILEKKGLKVQTDFSVECDTSDGGGAILGPNKSHQTFFPVKDFVTHGKYYFTLIMRTRQNNEENIPKIIPLCEMYNKNLMNSNI